MPYSRAPGIPGNENDHSRILGNEKTPPGMNSLVSAYFLTTDKAIVTKLDQTIKEIELYKNVEFGYKGRDPGHVTYF